MKIEEGQLLSFVKEISAINAAMNASVRAIEGVIIDWIETHVEGVVWALQEDATNG